MAIEEVVVKPRELTGKEAAGRLRRSGMIPGVVYGMGGNSVSVSVEPKIINRIIRSESGINTVLKLKLEGSANVRHVMIKEVDRHPVTDRLAHIDFLRIDMDKKLTATIPVDLVGTPEGVKLGGLLTIVRHEIDVECLAGDLPPKIQVNVEQLGLEDALRVSDLPEMEGIKYLLEGNRTIAVVHAPEAEEVAEEEEVDIVDEEPEPEA